MDEDIASLALNAMRRQKALNEERRLEGIGALTTKARLNCVPEKRGWNEWNGSRRIKESFSFSP